MTGNRVDCGKSEDLSKINTKIKLKQILRKNKPWRSELRHAGSCCSAIETCDTMVRLWL